MTHHSLQDTPKTLWRSVRRFSSGTLFSRVTGLARDVSMAAAFGTHPTVAAFMVAYRFANLFRRVLGEGAMQAAFVPYFEELRTSGYSRAQVFYKDLSFALAFVTLLLILLGEAGLTLWMAFGQATSSSLQILRQTSLLLPSLLFICLYGLSSARHHCDQNYFRPSFAPALCNLIWIATVALIAKRAPEEAMPWLCLGVTVAFAGQWAFTQFSLKHGGGISRASCFSGDVKKLLRPLALGIVGVGAGQLNNALDALFARAASLEGPAYLWYAIRLQQLPLSLFGVALYGALLPPLSRAAKAGQREKFASFLVDALDKCIYLLIPATCGLLCLGLQAIDILYDRGSFQTRELLETTHCLWGYSLGLAPAAMVLVLAAAHTARGNYQVAAQGSVFAVCMNIALNALFVFGLKWGSFSVALATSISAFLNLVWLLYGLKEDLRGHQFLKKTSIAFLCSICAAGALFLLSFKIDPTWGVLKGTDATWPFAAKLASLSIQSLLYFLFLRFFAKWMGAEALAGVFSWPFWRVLKKQK